MFLVKFHFSWSLLRFIFTRPKDMGMTAGPEVKGTGHCSRKGRSVGSVKAAQGKRSLKGPRHRWENINMDLVEVGLEGVDWIHLAQEMDQ
jgi:hypothetical protein